MAMPITCSVARPRRSKRPSWELTGLSGRASILRLISRFWKSKSICRRPSALVSSQGTSGAPRPRCFPACKSVHHRRRALAVAVWIGMLLLLQAARGSWRLPGLAFVTLVAATAGGLLAAIGSGGITSLGSLVGCLALFGIAARNGILLVK